MIEKHIAAAQVSRFSQLDWFPREAAGLNELVKAMQTAPNEFAAEYVATEWLREAREAPKPSDIMRALQGERDKMEKAVNNCKKCNGTGMVIVERGGFTGARDCECRHRKTA